MCAREALGGNHERIQIADDILLLPRDSESLSFQRPMLHELVWHRARIEGVVKPGAKKREALLY